MAVIDYETIIRRYLRELWLVGNLCVIDEVTVPNYMRHTSPGTPPLDREGQKARVLVFTLSLPSNSGTAAL